MSKSTACPCNVEWIRSIVGQCKAAGVACFVKQLGGNPIEDDPEKHDGARGHSAGRRWNMDLRDRKGGDPSEWPEDLRVREMPKERK